MRLLLDEMLSPAIARELRERGHDVLAVADHPGWVALSDPEVMTLARTERRAVVTNNLRDYRPLHADAITLCVPRISSVGVTSRVVLPPPGHDDHGSCVCGSSSS